MHLKLSSAKMAGISPGRDELKKSYKQNQVSQ